MASFYSNENFPVQTVAFLRELGHDVLTTQEAGKADVSIPDADVLDFAIQNNRCVVTLNRRDFMKLHLSNSYHKGIVVCKTDLNYRRQAEQIDMVIRSVPDLSGRLLRTVRGHEG